jgi:ribonuclease E
MTKRMLIDASHAEETRVVVLDGNRLEEFDLEAATRKPLKGNIYLAKVVRVEPSLQAAFVEYGGNRHGFLAFSEIHPDYYQIPIADRQRLLQMQAEEAREAEEADEDPIPESPMDRAAEEEIARRDDTMPEAPAPETTQAEAIQAETIQTESIQAETIQAGAEGAIISAAPGAEMEALLPATEIAAADTAPPNAAAPVADPLAAPDAAPASEAVATAAEPLAEAAPAAEAAALAEDDAAAAPEALRQPRRHGSHRRGRRGDQPREDQEDQPREDQEDQPREDQDEDRAEEEAPPETLGGEGPEEPDGGREERRIPPRFLRHYKIQEVIKRRQIMLVQVVKEERGTKGAALTSYISLAGRFSVLMPNSPRGGGVSRKITSATDRKRLREAIDEVGLPDGMSLIVRTAGAQRPKPEIKRDCEYLLRLWDNIRERTLASSAPALIYEEADLIKRAIRDVFSRDVEEIVIEGEDAYQDARDFMRMLMPQHVRKIQYARDGGLFARHQVEAQLDAMHSPTVQLKSGGYVVINQTEALVAIDVNSGRSTRERHIEDTALRTNLEAADEIARQLRLRDLAGLIVIDFIDMESSKHDGMVERRLKEALRHDRARIQVGRISHFGLLEMSRQRLRPSLAETSFVTCPHCQGRGTVRSLESSALQVLRAIEEEGARRRSAEIAVHVCAAVALYLLNRKRDRLTQIEEHFGMAVLFEPDESLAGPQHRIERLRAAEPSSHTSSHRAIPSQAALRMDYAPEPDEEEDEAEEMADDGAEAGADEEPGPAVARDGETQAEAEARVAADGAKRRRRRRRRRGARPDGGPQAEAAADLADASDEADDETAEGAQEGAAEEAGPSEAAAEPPLDGRDAEAEPAPSAEGGSEPRGRGRRRSRSRSPRPDAAPEVPQAIPVSSAPPPRYMGPTPADPFAGQVDDILAAMEAAEAAAEAAATSRQGRMSTGPLREAAPIPEAPKAMPEAVPGPSPAPIVAPDPAAAIAAAAPVAPIPEPIPPPEPVAAAAPEHSAESTPPAAAPEPDAAPAPEPLAPEPPAQGPAIQPKLLGETPVDAPRRGGWWRRGAAG